MGKMKEWLLVGGALVSGLLTGHVGTMSGASRAKLSYCDKGTEQFRHYTKKGPGRCGRDRKPHGTHRVVMWNGKRRNLKKLLGTRG